MTADGSEGLKASLGCLSTLPQEILLYICSYFCQCCRDEISKYPLNPQGNFGHHWYLLPGKKSDARTLSNLCLMSRSLRDAAQAVLHHAPYVEGTSSIVKLCRTVTSRPDLGLAIRVLPVWDFGGLNAAAERCAVLPMVDLLEENDILVAPELRKRQQSELELREDRAAEAATRQPVPIDSKPIPSFLPAYTMDMVVGMAKRAHSFYCVQAIRVFPHLAPPSLKPLRNLRECYLFLGEEDVGPDDEDFGYYYTNMAYDNMLPALFQACPQLSVLGLEVDLDTVGTVLMKSAFIAADDDIPIQRLEIRILQTRMFESSRSDGSLGTLLRWLVLYFEHASNLSEIYWILLASHSHAPTAPARQLFAPLLPVLDDFTTSMSCCKTTAMKNRIRRLAFLNPNLRYGDWKVIPDGHMRFHPAVNAEEENLSFGYFPNLEVLDISAHFAYQSSALRTLRCSVKEVRIHDAVPNVAEELEKDILDLLRNGIETDANGSSHRSRAPPVVFANPYHVRGVQSRSEDFLDETYEENDEVLNPCENALVPRTNAQLERDLRKIL